MTQFSQDNLMQLLLDLYEFLDDQADADGDATGYKPNRAMSLQMRVEMAMNELEESK